MAMPTTLWEEMLQRLRVENTSLSEIGMCTEEVIGEVLRDLGFSGLQRAKLQTEWAKRVTGVAVERNVLMDGEYGTRGLEVARVDRVTNPFCEEKLQHHCESTSESYSKLWLRPDYGNVDVDDVLLSGFTTEMSPVYVSMLPPPQSSRILLCKVITTSLTDTYEDGHLYAIHNPYQIAPCYLLSIRTSVARDRPVVHRELVSPSFDRHTSPFRTAPEVVPEPVMERIPPPPPLLSQPLVARCTKDDTLRLLNSTKKLMSVMSKPVVYRPPPMPLSPVQIEEAKRYAEMEIRPPTPPQQEKVAEEEEEREGEENEGEENNDNDEEGTVRGSERKDARLTIRSEIVLPTPASMPASTGTRPGTATRGTIESVRPTTTATSSNRQTMDTSMRQTTASARATGSTHLPVTTNPDRSSRQTATNEAPTPLRTEGSDEEDPDFASSLKRSFVRSSMKTGDSQGLKTVVLGDFALQPASRTESEASESNRLSLGDNPKLLQTMGASTMDGESPKVSIQAPDELVPVLYVDTTMVAEEPVPSAASASATPVLPTPTALTPAITSVQSTTASIKNHNAPYVGVAQSATISSVHTSPLVPEIPERPPPGRLDEYNNMFKQNVGPIKKALATGNPEDVVQEAVDMGYSFPMPPSPTPKLNPTTLGEPQDENEEVEEPKVRPMEEWEIKVQHALSRIKTLNVNQKPMHVKRSGVLANCFTPGSAYTGRSEPIPAAITPSAYMNAPHIKTPPNNGKSFLVESSPEPRHVSPVRNGPSMKSHAKTTETVDVTQGLLGTVAGYGGGEGVLSEPPPPHLGMDFGETLMKIEACTKADFDAVSSKIETLKGKMEATHQSWTTTSPIKLAADRWRGAELPGGLWGPTYKATAADYHKVLEPRGF